MIAGHSVLSELVRIDVHNFLTLDFALLCSHTNITPIMIESCDTIQEMSTSTHFKRPHRINGRYIGSGNGEYGRLAVQQDISVGKKVNPTPQAE